MTDVEKFYHCRLTGLMECVMINMGCPLVEKKHAPVYIDVTLPLKRSRRIKKATDIYKEEEDSREI